MFIKENTNDKPPKFGYFFKEVGPKECYLFREDETVIKTTMNIHIIYILTKNKYEKTVIHCFDLNDINKKFNLKSTNKDKSENFIAQNNNNF